jgi:hypothetical protein
MGVLCVRENREKKGNEHAVASRCVIHKSPNHHSDNGQKKKSGTPHATAHSLEAGLKNDSSVFAGAADDLVFSSLSLEFRDADFAAGEGG